MGKLFLILLVCFAVLCSTVVMADEGSIGSFDGNEWVSWDAHKRVYFVTGFISGSDHLVDNTVNIFTDRPYDSAKAEKAFSKLTSAKDTTKFSKEETTLLIERAISLSAVFHRSSLHGYALYNITSLQIAEGLDELYKDFKNKNITINDAIYVVKRQINGTPHEDIENILLFLRSGKQESEYLFKTDEQGKKRYLGFP